MNGSMWLPPREPAPPPDPLPLHVPKAPTHPGVEHEEPVTRGVYGAWCGAPIWDHQVVHDATTAALYGLTVMTGGGKRPRICPQCVDKIKAALDAVRAT